MQPYPVKKLSGLGKPLPLLAHSPNGTSFGSILIPILARFADITWAAWGRVPNWMITSSVEKPFGNLDCLNSARALLRLNGYCGSDLYIRFMAVFDASGSNSCGWISVCSWPPAP
jgi:hypothetical protein